MVFFSAMLNTRIVLVIRLNYTALGFDCVGLSDLRRKIIKIQN